MRRLAILGFASALWLAACGGDTLSGKATTTTPTTPTTPAATGISVLTSSPQVASDGSAPVTIRAFVHDASNNTISGAPVSFAATSGLLSVASGTTDATGAATATLSAGADPTNRPITVTATSSTVSAPVTVNVAGTTLLVAGPTSLVAPAEGPYLVSLQNASGGIPNEQVALSSSNGNTLSSATVMTDTNGQATFKVTATTGGDDTITATALGASSVAKLSVSTQSFVITLPTDPPTATAGAPQVKLGDYRAVILTWKNDAGFVTHTPVTFATTRGSLYAAPPPPSTMPLTSPVTANTDTAGQAIVYLASTTAGAATITASGTDGSQPVSAQVEVDFIATAPASIDAQASPTTIATGAQSTITAVVRDAQNNLVENQLVTFSLSDVTGGTLSAPSAMTDSQGIAKTIYTAGTTTSATNGVTVKADVQALDGTTKTDSTTLSVAGKTVFLSLGTGNTVASINGGTQYSMPYSVQAIDGAGNAVPGAAINLKVVAVNYAEGQMTFNAVKTIWEAPPVQCGTEDANPFGGNANYNGILDPAGTGIPDPGEDFNGDGKLQPGTVAAASPGTVVTTTAAAATADNPAGSATFAVVYPKDHAYWVQIALVATASVAGTESVAHATFVLPGAAADYNQATVAPPGQQSPYGLSGACKPPIPAPFYLTSY